MVTKVVAVAPCRKPLAAIATFGAALAALGLFAGASAAALPAGCTQSGQIVSCSVTYTSGSNPFTVPAGVASIHAVAVGGMGSGPAAPNGGFVIGGPSGGFGAVVSGDLTVTAGSTVYAVVGSNGDDAVHAGLGGGGGASSNVAGPTGGGGIGGGASDVRTVPNDLSTRLLVAGGGGGAGDGGGPGGAGGSGSGSGAAAPAPGGGGTGGTATSGGSGGIGGTCDSGCFAGNDGGAGGSGFGGSGGNTALALINVGPPPCTPPAFTPPGDLGSCAELVAGGGGGGGGGGGLFGGGGGGAGGAALVLPGTGVSGCTPTLPCNPFNGGGGGGGGGGGSNLVPPGGSASVDTTGLPLVQISYKLVPTSISQCLNGGWQDYPQFKNQGDCVSFVATGK